MSIPYVIDNVQHRLADTLKTLLDRSVGRPLDIATAYFSVSGYRLVKDGVHHLGAFRLLLGSEPHAGDDIGLRADPQRLRASRRMSRRSGGCMTAPSNSQPMTASWPA
jgi:hypothetical protein